MVIRYGSVCSGVEAATAAWHTLGWQPQWFAEIEKFPSAVLKHHYPDVPNLGDMTKLHESTVFNELPIDLLVGGTPCQSFSVAGLRKGMADPRGNLALVYLALAAAKRPRWIVWENVPGVLSSNKGRDFGAFLGGLEQLGYGFAYRVLDAQYFGVAQRRRRVFVVGYLGDWRRAAEVLFEPHSMQGHPAPRRETGTPVSTLTAAGVGTCGADDNQAQAGHLVPTVMPTMRAGAPSGGKGHGARSGDTKDEYIVPVLAGTLTTNLGHSRFGAQEAAGNHLVAHTLRAEGFDASEDGTGRGIPLVAAHYPAEIACTLNAAFGKKLGLEDQHINGGAQLFVPIAFHASQDPISGNIVPALGANATMGVYQNLAVRRLTPRECERLQDFDDDYTLITPKTADGPRYKSMGNSMCRAVMAWLGQRIDAVDAQIMRLDLAA